MENLPVRSLLGVVGLAVPHVSDCICDSAQHTRPHVVVDLPVQLLKVRLALCAGQGSQELCSGVDGFEDDVRDLSAGRSGRRSRELVVADVLSWLVWSKEKCIWGHLPDAEWWQAPARWH